jgi:WD domain, G-beta repeat
MNLELLDPFGRQVPDRVDATIQLADILYYPPDHQQQQRLHNITLTAAKQISATTKSSSKKNKYYVNDEEEEEDDDDDDDDNDENENEDGDDTNRGDDLDDGKRRTETLKRMRPSEKNKEPRRKVEKQNNVSHDTINSNGEWKAACTISYNRRGNYLAVGYGSGTVAVFCTLTRTLSSLYYPDNLHHNLKGGNTKSKVLVANSKSKSSKSATKNASSIGCSSLSWARRSRRLLVGSFGDTRVKVYDTTHPLGPEDCASAAATIVSYYRRTTALSSSTNTDQNDADNDSMMGETAEVKTKVKEPSPLLPVSHQSNMLALSGFMSNIIPSMDPFWTKATSENDYNAGTHQYKFVRDTLPLPTKRIERKTVVHAPRERDSATLEDTPMIDSERSRVKRYPCVSFDFEHPVIGSVHIHPQCPHTGIAVLSDGSLVAFVIPFEASPFVNHNASQVGPMNNDTNKKKNSVLSGGADDNKFENRKEVKIYPVYNESMISCASFDSLGSRIYAVTKAGTLLGFDVSDFWMHFFSSDTEMQQPVKALEPNLVIVLRHSGNKASDNTTSSSPLSVWHLIVSRNGKFLIVNSSDGTIRLYNTLEMWKSNSDIAEVKPTWIFQDVVTKVKFASCDLSGDGEYVVGGANGTDNKYELHIWNSSTGALMDKLTGASTKLLCVAWHPTRPFLAVACADGLVDVWGPRINWTAFAPDFQALPMNVEYIEREDEFDVDVDGRHLAEGLCLQNETGDMIQSESSLLNLTRVEQVPVFASDSEEEEEVFQFETRVKNVLTSRVIEAKSNKKGLLDD